MKIPNLIWYLQHMQERDVKPEHYTVYRFPDRYTILQLLTAIGDKLANLWQDLQITSSTETLESGQQAEVTVEGNADKLEFNFKIPSGPEGPAGPQGDPGPVTITVGDTVTAEAGTPAAVENTGSAENVILKFTIPKGPQGPAGQDGAPGAQGPQGPAGQDGAPGAQGPQGPAGQDGAPGAQGPQGPAGQDGAPGAQGPQGPAGQAATITVGTITTGEPGTDATVTNVGSASAAKFNFTIPRGEKGEPGQGVDAYSKTESDAKYATKVSLQNVEQIANQAQTEANSALSQSQQALSQATAATSSVFTVELPADNWFQLDDGSGAWEQTAICMGMYAAYNPLPPTIQTTGNKETDLARLEALACIQALETRANQIYLLAYENKPEIDITITLTIVR